MQEITIRQRSYFTHYVTVDEGSRELCWAFHTKRKNLAFQLLWKPLRLPSDDTKNTSAAPLARDEGRGSASSISSLGKKQLFLERAPQIHERQGSLDAKVGTHHNHHDQVDRHHSHKDKVDRHASHQDQKHPSIHDIYAPRSSISNHKSASRSELMDFTEIIPLAHYNSSKHTIRGSYFIQQPGTFALVFDNTFSVKTSKKLFFFVGLKEIDATLDVNRHALQGWMMKKGNRAMQGWQKRWVELGSNGVLSYFRNPKGTNHGSVNLRDCAVRADHDNVLLDIGFLQLM